MRLLTITTLFTSVFMIASSDKVKTRSLIFEMNNDMQAKSGIPSIGRITGGKLVKIEKHPYVAQLIHEVEGSKFFFCSGTIVSRKTVLTAAHCFLAVNPPPQHNDTFVLTGSEMLLQGDRNTVKEILIHDDYKGIFNTLGSDIAILLTNDEITFGDKVAAANLPAPYHVLPDNMTVVAVGWRDVPPEEIQGTEGLIGKTSGDLLAQALNEVALTTVPRKICVDAHRQFGLKTVVKGVDELNSTLSSKSETIATVDQNVVDTFFVVFESVMNSHKDITDAQFCAGEIGNGNTTVRGDSGGPVMQDDTLVGITSGSPENAGKSLPNVFTRVSKFIPWITRQIEPKCGKGPCELHV